jgi:hypothetical protein
MMAGGVSIGANQNQSSSLEKNTSTADIKVYEGGSSLLFNKG